MTKAYPSNLTRTQFELLNDLIPEPKTGGRPRQVEMWAVLNAIFACLGRGGAVAITPRRLSAVADGVRLLPGLAVGWNLDQNPRPSAGVGENRALPRQPSPSEAVFDSQSVKSAAKVSEAVGFDGGKLIRGRKRFLTVDTLGLVLRVLVTSANVGERAGGEQILQRVQQQGQAVSRLHTIWVDGGFDGEPFLRWVMDVCRWIVEVVLRPQQTKGFVLLKKRWVVERTLGWLMGCRRLVRDYELLPETSETLIYLAMIRIMVRRLA